MGTAVDVKIHHESMRAVKARFAVRFNGLWYRTATVAAILFLVVGITCVVIGQPVGWLALGLSALPIMCIEWYDAELKHLRITKSPQGITDVLDGTILGLLPKNFTSRDIAIAAGRSREGQFLSARLGLTARLLQDITEHANPTVEKIWQDALKYREKIHEPSVSAGAIILSLLQQFPEHAALIAKINLTDSDIVAGALWYRNLMKLVDESSKKNRTGGIARDWSFGYIPKLAHFGQNISDQVSRGLPLTVDIDEHQKSLTQMVDTFNGSRQNIAVVGKEGAGKTTIVQAFASKLLDADAPMPSSLRFQQIFMLDATSLLSAAPGRGELEELVVAILSEAYAAKNIIIFLDNAQLFFEEGTGSVDISNTLLPILETGNLRMILSMDEQRYLQISQSMPGIINNLIRINIRPSNETETIAVMQNKLIDIEFARKVTFTYQSLKETYRLSERYVHDLAMPGRALKLLETSAGFSENGLVTMNSVQQAIEETMDVKVSVASEADDRERLLNLEQLIHKRMINQTRAVTVVSDALRRAMAGVRNQDRPIGTFLFLGPTGVGKTELAKALAEVYFGGESRIVRLDLNEYVQNEDVSRLIADATEDASSLTAQVIKQPFSVVLLDEIEKAHPNVLTTLLQVLDEGILRDERNREVSFRDTIIIATSNAGAERIRELVMRGQQPAQFEDQFIDELISSGQFKPEFLNRFDEIITFTPLSKDDLLKVINLMIDSVNKTLKNQNVSVEVEQSAKVLLVEKGYDPRLGARPMRRVVQKAVENTVAKAMLSGEAGAGSNIVITYDQVASIFGAQAEAESVIVDAA